MTRHLATVLALVAAAFFLFADASVASGHIRDRDNPADPLLDGIAKRLDANGIDVQRQWGATLPRAGRPIVGRLDSYPADFSRATSKRIATEFVRGAFANRAILAVHTGVGETIPKDRISEFERTWQAADESQRVFLSFARKDAGKAKVVAKALRANGYVVFTYVDDSSATPEAALTQIGAWLVGAGHRLVLDTKRSRKSAGVLSELAVAHHFFLGNPGPLTTIVADLEDMPCCKPCYYRDGVLVYCDPPVCGHAECAGAI